MIRQATLEDEPIIRACARAAYQQYVASIGKEPAPMNADFAAQIAMDRVFVAETEARDISGYIVFYTVGASVLLENIAVFPETTGKGIGRALIDFCEANARSVGARSIELYTNEKMTSNLKIYPKLGYIETDRRTEDGFARVYFEKVLI